MDQWATLPVVHLGSIDKRLLVNRDQDDEVHGPFASLARRVGVVRLLSTTSFSLSAGHMSKCVPAARGPIPRWLPRVCREHQIECSARTDSLGRRLLALRRRVGAVPDVTGQVQLSGIRPANGGR
jgi:hypothetical protein